MAQENARKKQKKTRTKKYRKPVNWLILLIIMTVFQLVCAAQINMNSPDIPLSIHGAGAPCAESAVCSGTSTWVSSSSA